MNNLVSFLPKIEAGARFILPVWQKDICIDQYEVEITKVDESVYMTAVVTGKTGIESLTSFQANLDAGNYIEIL